jgi:hypothetical protein
VSRKNVFLFGDSQQSDSLTHIVIRHCVTQEKVRNSLKEFIRPYWSLVEQADNLRKLFIQEIIQCLTDNQGRYPEVTGAILLDWSRYVAYAVVGWIPIYRALETNTPLPSSANDLTSAVYRILSRRNWRLVTEGAKSYEQGGEMLCNTSLTSLQTWLDHRQGFNFSDMSMQIIFHSYAYAVHWEKVVQALYDQNEDGPLPI